jgi:hypothetical protein
MEWLAGLNRERYYCWGLFKFLFATSIFSLNASSSTGDVKTSCPAYDELTYLKNIS